MSEYFDGPTYVRCLVQLKKPMKIEISESLNIEKTALFPVNSVMFVDFEIANMWSEKDKAEIIGISKEEYRKLDRQLNEAEMLELVLRYKGTNFVKGDNEKAVQLKASLGLEDC
ncbi:hypothetical protein AKJ37_00670 [candidate division MSBL1 archaeon SCGC-AAA259I09]|uniref:Uncharacterized protein n=1 Tax=candidate division MSBL1 archaeon SCGC-AAA259I09 TaxID=1698267 RepID=A0A133UVQ6_9EURY|nr:hypothetical protein AKJ37_00670 [candidate division MSBL1 archaeon SCGC-AAA259I09]